MGKFLSFYFFLAFLILATIVVGERPHPGMLHVIIAMIVALAITTVFTSR